MIPFMYKLKIYITFIKELYFSYVFLYFITFLYDRLQVVLDFLTTHHQIFALKA